MAKYKIEIARSAEKQLAELDKAEQIRVLKRIVALAGDPTPPGCRKLSGEEDAYRIRVGTFRVIYTIENKILTVRVVKVGHRKDVYR